MTRRLLEIESLASFDRHLRGGTALHGWFVQSVDLSERRDALRTTDPQGAVFLGCRFAPGDEAWLRARGGLIFPALPDLPFDPYRSRLYRAEDLYDTTAYADSSDAAIYAWSRTPQGRSLSDALAITLHDHAVTDALDDATAGLDPRLVVGVMGGHAVRRDDPAYAQAVGLGAELARAGRAVLTGGGPGAMEAANLGAYLSPWADALPAATASLAAAPSFADGIDSWLAAARRVRERWPLEEAGTSLSIPTWFHGHEPSNTFATAIAKYFTNALREDTLLHRCRGGIVYLPGAAGTVQEIFQAVTENYYAADPGQIAPLVLVGVEHWTQRLPAWPLLERLGAGRAMGRAIACVPDIAAALDYLLSRPD